MNMEGNSNNKLYINSNKVTTRPQDMSIIFQTDEGWLLKILPTGEIIFNENNKGSNSEKAQEFIKIVEEFTVTRASEIAKVINSEMHRAVRSKEDENSTWAKARMFDKIVEIYEGKN